jgi:hypothetical protein
LRDGGVAMKNILGVSQIISTKNLTSSLFPAFGGRGRLARRSKQVLRLFIPRDFLRFHHI